MASRYLVTVAGPVPAAVAELIRLRFGDVSVSPLPEGRTVLEGEVLDQSAVRALLNLLWDVGSDVRTLRVTARGR